MLRSFTYLCKTVKRTQTHANKGLAGGRGPNGADQGSTVGLAPSDQRSDSGMVGLANYSCLRCCHM